VKKLVSGSSAAAYVGLLEKSKTSNDALQVLLRISDSLKFQVCTEFRWLCVNVTILKVSVILPHCTGKLLKTVPEEKLKRTR